MSRPMFTKPLSKEGDHLNVETQNLIPFIFFNTIPKSGSVYIVNTLSMGLDVPIKTISLGYFPSDLVDIRALSMAAQGNSVCQSHVNASPINLRLLKLWLDKIVIHVRDLRQATLSWTHHLRWLYSNESFLIETVDPPLPKGYFDWNLSDQIGYQLRHHLPQLVRWFQGWLDVMDGVGDCKQMRIMITRYEDFIDDDALFIQNICKFYGIPPNLFDCSRHPVKDRSSNFRVGRKDEWEEVFSDRQKEYAASLIPARQLRIIQGSKEQ